MSGNSELLSLGTALQFCLRTMSIDAWHCIPADQLETRAIGAETGLTRLVPCTGQLLMQVTT